jgi:hypothetical protein
MRSRTHMAAWLAAALCVSVPVVGSAQTPPYTPRDTETRTQPSARPQAQPAARPAAESPAIDPGTMTALNRMAAYLKTLKAFQVEADITKEEVLTDGQKVQFGGVANMVVERPNRLRLDVSSDRQQRLFLFDGQTFTVYASKMKYYAQVPAPGTIGQLIERIEQKHEVELPLVDFFRWGEDEAMLGDITHAKDMGPSVIDGVTTQHYMIRQDGLDWQIWIQTGDFPLPRKVVLTTTTDEARPQYTAIYKWNLAPSFNEGSFTFTAPEDAKMIPMGEVPTELEPREEGR